MFSKFQKVFTFCSLEFFFQFLAPLPLMSFLILSRSVTQVYLYLLLILLSQFRKFLKKQGKRSFIYLAWSSSRNVRYKDLFFEKNIIHRKHGFRILYDIFQIPKIISELFIIYFNCLYSIIYVYHITHLKICK